MKRNAKRFTKKLMSFGYSPKDTQKLLEYARVSIFDYKYLLESARFSMRSNKIVHDKRYQCFLKEEYRFDNLKRKSFTHAVTEFSLDIDKMAERAIKASGVLERENYINYIGSIKPQAFRKRSCYK